MLGIFDSGMGGLSVLKEVRRVAPQVDIVYFGDTKHAPYGNRSLSELGALTAIGIQKLMHEGASEIITACNTVSVQIVEPMYDILGIKKRQIIEMVGPAVAELSRRYREQSILLLATQATVQSGLYQSAAAEQGLTVAARALPELVGLIESGEEREVIKAYITSELKNTLLDYSLVVFGCTHYPLVRDVFLEAGEEIGYAGEWFDPALAVARKAKAEFDLQGSGSTQFILSKDSAPFRALAEELGIQNPSYSVV